MFSKRVLKTTGIVAFTLIAVAACRPEEQGREFRHQPGVMKQVDPSAAISEDSLAEMRQRAVLQGGIIIGHGSTGGGPTTGSNVRPPSGPESDALRQRGQYQGGN